MFHNFHLKSEINSLTQVRIKVSEKKITPELLIALGAIVV